MSALSTPNLNLTLHEINTTTAQVTAVGGAFTNAIHGIGNIASTAGGTLHVLQNTAFGPAEGFVYAVDAVTGVETVGAALSAFRVGIGWCASTYLEGTLFALDGGSDTGTTGVTRVLVSVDPVTGVRTQVGDTGNAALDALASPLP